MPSNIVKVRKPQGSYEPTPGQLAAREHIKTAGQRIRAECAGLKGDEFVTCRRDVLASEFPSKETTP